MVRVYTKPKVYYCYKKFQGQVPDYEAPVIMTTKRCKVEDFCKKIHRDLLKDLKYAIVWGSSVKHQGMKV